MQAIEQNTQEWLEFRKDKIGASDMPIILGLSPYCTPYELWRRILGFSEEQKENYAMARGKELEPYVRDYINENTEYFFTPEVIVSSHFDWAMASLDGIDAGSKVGLEIKCTSQKNHSLIEKRVCPEIFYPQVQWQMFCADLEHVLIAHMFGENIVQMMVRRDDTYIESTLIPAAKEFRRCIVELIPPEATESDYVFINDEEFENVAEKWKEVHLKLKELKKQEEEYKKQLIELTDDGNCRGYGILIKKKTRKGSIDWNTLWEKACKKFPIKEEFNPEFFRKEDAWYWDVRIEKKETHS